jgi:thiosulfate/3-mercaptopyruvate sulfurtransferase
MFTNIISCQDLAKHIQDPDWVIIDTRFDLSNPDWGYDNYQAGHIPGAIYADMNRDYAGQVTPQTGRHPLPELTDTINRISAWGIQPTSQVVVYDATNGGMASRLWFYFRYLGHESVAVLSGGWAAWIAEKLPVKTGVETRRPSDYPTPPVVHSDWVVTTEQVEQIRSDPNYVLIDARSHDRFRGENETIDPVAGHIPGAINRFYGENSMTDGKMKPADTLKKEFEQLLAGKPANQAVVYCGSGVTSCNHLLAMDVAGLSGARIYVGSWSEWVRNPNRPIAKGD